MDRFFPLLLNFALLLTLLALLWSDLRHRFIANRRVLFIALLGLAGWTTQPGFGWADAAERIALMLGALGLFSIPFLFGWMGGGDVKLFAALALHCDPERYLQLLLIISLVGIPLSLYALGRKYLSTSKEHDYVPYGIAITIGAIWVLCQPVVNHFVG